MKVLHITPHLGGGVGTVVRNYLEYVRRNSPSEHLLLSLETLNDQSKEFLLKIKCDFAEQAFLKPTLITDLIDVSDIVLVHWWNHPLLQYFLMNVTLPESRLIFWSHISGSPTPNSFCQFALSYPDRFIFTTPLSQFSNEVNILSVEAQLKIGCIWSTAGVERLSSFDDNKDMDRRDGVCYVGNLDYTKLHKGFLEACSSLISMGHHLNVVGPNTEDFLEDLQKVPISKRPAVHGFVGEERKFEILRNSRIFGYPLARHNYATCDQALQEAMFFGTVPVVLNNPMETYMVKHRVNGLVASSLAEYTKFVSELIEDKNELKKLSENSREFAREAYSIEKMADSWENEFGLLLKTKKKKRQCLKQVTGHELKGCDVFIESLGSNSAVFKFHRDATTNKERLIGESQIKCLSSLPQWSSSSKSTPSHYSAHFPDDPVLRQWARLTRSTLGK